jgi:hypothetical protein
MTEKVLGGFGAVAVTVFVGVQIFLYVGGISYQEQCVTDQGHIAKSWSFTRFAPVPYLFRPDDPGCIVHTGTRVALNALGVAKYSDATASTIAERAVKQANPSADDAYWAKLNGDVADYGNRNEHVHDVNEALRSVDTFLGQLASLSPPAKYAQARAALVAALRQVDEHGKAMREAAQAGDSAAFERAKSTVTPDAQKVQQAMEQLNLAHAAG